MADAVVVGIAAVVVVAVAGMRLGADPLGCSVEECVRGRWIQPETCRTVALQAVVCRAPKRA